MLNVPSLQAGKPRPERPAHREPEHETGGAPAAHLCPKVTGQRSVPSCPARAPVPAPPALCRRPGSSLSGRGTDPGIMGKQFHLYVGSDPTRSATFCAMAEPVGRLWASSASFLLLAARTQNSSSGFGQTCVLLPVQVHTLLAPVSGQQRSSSAGRSGGPCEYRGTPRGGAGVAVRVLATITVGAPAPAPRGEEGKRRAARLARGAQPPAGEHLVQVPGGGGGPVGFLGRCLGAEARLGLAPLQQEVSVIC